MSKDSVLSDRARENLFSRVASMRVLENTPRIEIPYTKGPEDRWTDFATLPGYDELRVQRTIAERLQLENDGRVFRV